MYTNDWQLDTVTQMVTFHKMSPFSLKSFRYWRKFKVWPVSKLSFPKLVQGIIEFQSKLPVLLFFFFKLQALSQLEKQKIFLARDGFKLHNMVVDKTNSGCRGRIVWITQFFLCGQIFLSATIFYSLKLTLFLDLLYKQCYNSALCSFYLFLLALSPNGLK